jgi:hypothetical protein
MRNWTIEKLQEMADKAYDPIKQKRVKKGEDKILENEREINGEIPEGDRGCSEDSYSSAGETDDQK